MSFLSVFLVWVLAAELGSLISGNMLNLQKIYYRHKFVKYCKAYFGDCYDIEMSFITIKSTTLLVPGTISSYVYLNPKPGLGINKTSGYLEYNTKFDIYDDLTLRNRYANEKRDLNPGELKRYNRNKRIEEIL